MQVVFSSLNVFPFKIMLHFPRKNKNVYGILYKMKTEFRQVSSKGNFLFKMDDERLLTHPKNLH